MTRVNSRASVGGRKKSAGGNLRRIVVSPDLRSAYALFIAAFTASAVIGSERTRAPEALKIALPIAGAITVTAGSPTPVAFSPLAMTLTRSEERRVGKECR